MSPDTRVREEGASVEQGRSRNSPSKKPEYDLSSDFVVLQASQEAPHDKVSHSLPGRYFTYHPLAPQVNIIRDILIYVSEQGVDSSPHTTFELYQPS